jgi:uncharacterized protein YjiS (DUF1127 family)
MANDGFDPDAGTVRHLSCRERTALKKRVLARADKERRRLLRQWTGRSIQAFHQLWKHLSKPFIAAVRRFLIAQRRQAELRQLGAMSDRELRDLAISRLEIRAAMQSGATWPRDDRNVSAMQSPQGDKPAQGLLNQGLLNQGLLDRPRLCSRS